jgi:hypothetical protein
MLRRRRLPSDLAPAQVAFQGVLRLVERAKEAVVDAMPRARAPGRVLGEALFELEEALREAQGAMDGWWHPAVAAEWDECSKGLRESLRRAEELRLEAPELSFDAMAFTVQDLISPLEPFEAAALRLRSLRI